MFNELYKTWSKLGVGFLETPSEAVIIDLEKTIIQTTHAGREDSRLLFGMRAWLLKHHDLVNVSRLIRFIKTEKETAVLGAIIDSILDEEPRSTLRYIGKYCKKVKISEFVFRRIAKSPVQSELNRQENLPIWSKWNLISREMSSMEGVIMEKAYVFQHNYNLALRALFGPIIKADLLTFLIEHKEGNAHQIAKSIGLSYEPVYTELKSFKEMGLIEEKKQGLAKVFKIKTVVKTKLKALLNSSFAAPKKVA